MHRYETIFVVNPDLSDDETQSVIKKFAGIVSAGGGVPLKLEDWGRRRLAYKIDKFQQGYYVLLDFASQPPVLMELERNLKIDDRIIRFLSVKTGVNVNVEALQQELAAKAKPKEEVQAPVEVETDVIEVGPAAAPVEPETEKTPEE
jgi:small subunit ribosomal protein S6